MVVSVTYFLQPLCASTQSKRVISYCASFGRISGFMLPSPSSASISFTTSGIRGSSACLLNASNKSNSEFSSISTPKSYNLLIGALQARKLVGRGPKLMIFKFLTATNALATGANS